MLNFSYLDALNKVDEEILMVTALRHRDENWELPRQLHETEAEVVEYLICDVCGTYWSPEADDYPWLMNDDHISCSCGNLLSKKSDLI